MPAKGSVTIDEGYCKGCGICVYFCPKDVLIIDTETVSASGYNPAAAKGEACVGCASCARMCPEAAITVERF